jgi:hypothetical protein
MKRRARLRWRHSRKAGDGNEERDFELVEPTWGRDRALDRVIVVAPEDRGDTLFERGGGLGDDIVALAQPDPVRRSGGER